MLGVNDLSPERLRQKIAAIPSKFVASMTERQFNAVRAILDPLNRAADPVSGRFKGIYDRAQEAIAKEQVREGTDGDLQAGVFGAGFPTTTPGEGHLNPAGHRIAASVIWAQLAGPDRDALQVLAR